MSTQTPPRAPPAPAYPRTRTPPALTVGLSLIVFALFSAIFIQQDYWPGCLWFRMVTPLVAGTGIAACLHGPIRKAWAGAHVALRCTVLVLGFLAVLVYLLAWRFPA
jgi:hypothetical protein